MDTSNNHCVTNNNNNNHPPPPPMTYPMPPPPAHQLVQYHQHQQPFVPLQQQPLLMYAPTPTAAIGQPQSFSMPNNPVPSVQCIFVPMPIQPPPPMPGHYQPPQSLSGPSSPLPFPSYSARPNNGRFNNSNHRGRGGRGHSYQPRPYPPHPHRQDSQQLQLQQQYSNQQDFQEAGQQPPMNQPKSKNILQFKDPNTNEQIKFEKANALVPKTKEEVKFGNQTVRDSKSKEEILDSFRKTMMEKLESSEDNAQEQAHQMVESVVSENKEDEQPNDKDIPDPVDDSRGIAPLVDKIAQCQVTDDDAKETEDEGEKGACYDRDTLYEIRALVSEQGFPCPLSQERIEELGLKVVGPPVPTPPKIEREDPPKTESTKFRNEGSFKLDWQQNPSSNAGGGGARRWQTQTSGGEHFGQRRQPYYGRSSGDGRQAFRKYEGRSSIDKRFAKHENSPFRYRDSDSHRSTTPQPQPPDGNAKRHTLTEHKENEQREQPKRQTSPAKNVWKPRKKVADEGADPEVLKIETLCKEIRSLLNKITPTTYEDLSKEFCAFKIYEDNNLMMSVIDLIFEKAVDEPSFCPLYSDLCKRQVDVQQEVLKESLPPGTDILFHMKTFMCGIVKKSQRTFEDSPSSAVKIEELKKKKLEEDLTEQEIAALDEEIEMISSKEKRRLIGNIRFIAQLYRLNLLTHYIINSCFSILMTAYYKNNDETYLEYAVELLETVGGVYSDRMKEADQKQLMEKQKKPPPPPPVQTAKPTPAPTSYSNAAADPGKWDTIKPSQEDKDRQKQAQLKPMILPSLLSALSDCKPKVSKRICFKIMNLEDLSKSNWKPRGGDKGPKTIDEVREEAEMEQRMNEAERRKYEEQQEREREARMRDRDRMRYGTVQRRHGGPPVYHARNSLPDNRRPPTPSSSTYSAMGSSQADAKRHSRMAEKLSTVDSVSNFGGGRRPWAAGTEVKLLKREENWRDNAKPTDEQPKNN